MKYSLSDPLHRQQLRTRLAYLLKKGSGMVELRELRHGRTLRQNAYLHTLLAYFGLQVGEPAEVVKREYYKLAANRATFLTEAVSRVTGQPAQRLRSTATLTTEELSLTIDRFRHWASQEAGIYLPSPDDHRAVEQMELEVERAGEWL